jgi:hypothetical protein
MAEAKPASPPTSLAYLNVFLASPGDVSEERGIARDTVEKLPKDALLRGRIAVDLVAWDGPGGAAMEAGLTPQEAIKRGLRRPADCDIVIVILWSRMGTPLPADWDRKPDGSPYRSGTEWEYLDALGGFQRTGTPSILVYRRTTVPSVALSDPDIEEKTRQLRAVNAFFAEFRNPDGSFKGGYKEYAAPAELRELIDNDLRALVKGRLDRQPAATQDGKVEESRSALTELNALGARILELYHFKSVADRLHGLYMDPEVRFLRSQSGHNLSPHSLRRAVRSGETALEGLRGLEAPATLTQAERKREQAGLERLARAVAELSAAAGGPSPDAQTIDDAVANFTIEIVTERDAHNKLAEDEWNALRLGDLGPTFERARSPLSVSHPGYMARVDEGYQALTRQPPLFTKCNALAKEHELLEKTLRELSWLRRQLEASFSLPTLRSTCVRMNGYLDGARGFWEEFRTQVKDTDDWAVALLNSGVEDWNSIHGCREAIEALIGSPEPPPADTFLDKLREGQEIIEPHFQAVDEALAGAYREVKTRLGEALTAVPAGVPA